MKSSVTFVLVVAVFSTIFVGSSGSSLGGSIGDLIDGALGGINGALEGILGIVNGLLQKLPGLLTSVLDTVGNALAVVDGGLQEATGDTEVLLSNVQGTLKNVTDVVEQLEAAVADALKTNTTAAWEEVSGLLSKATSLIASLGQLQVNVAANVDVDGLLKPVLSVIPPVIDTLKNLVNNVLQIVTASVGTTE